MYYDPKSGVFRKEHVQQNLRWNAAAGVWMPPIEIKPAVRNYVPPQPLLQNRPRLASIPPLPAIPLSPRPQRFAVPTSIRGPTYADIPLRPQILPPNMRPLPRRIQQKAKWGQYTLAETLPIPETLPQPNLPRMTQYNAQMLKAQQAKINRQMANRGGEIPAVSRFLMSRGIRQPIRMADLGRNLTKGSNSQLLTFGNHLGRTLERVW